jgi:hypothetical protein
MDSGDKASNKAMSVAYKYAFMQIFCIPTEEEKDTEYKSPEVKPKDKPVESEGKTIKTEMYSQEKVVGGKKWIRREGVKDGKKWVLWTDGEKKLWGDKSFIDYSAQVVDSDL